MQLARIQFRTQCAPDEKGHQYRRDAWAVLSVVVAGCAATALGGTLARDHDPVVLTGANLPMLTGNAPGDIVAFRFDAGTWTQIPVQIDERAVVDFAQVYNEAPVGLTTLAYTDPNTYMGPDPDPSFDSDDELVFMAADSGSQAPGSVEGPSAVVAGSGVELTINDPLGGTGYVYLFVSNGTLDPGAGQSYVSYQFNLLAGSYLPNYSTLAGPNPEDSSITTAAYSVHFSDRWIRDETRITIGGATGVDILDRHKAMFAPGDCGRTEDTFSNGEGAFYVNKSGPVRALRSYIGANSGVLTQRDHAFYARREDITTFLRVHTISGVMDLMDYSPDAVGMTYYSDLNLGGVAVDGVPDTVATGPITWEMVSGSQGTLVLPGAIETDIPSFGFSSYYSDDSTPSTTQCTGDAFEYATSGIWVNQSIPNTDPTLGPANTFIGHRTLYYEPPNQSTSLAFQLASEFANPLSSNAGAYANCPGDVSGDGVVDLTDLGSVLAYFGQTGPALAGDVNGDQIVDLTDLGIVLAHFGQTC